MNKFRVYINNIDVGVFAAETDFDALESAGAVIDGLMTADSYAVQIICDEEVFERDEAGMPVHYRGEDGLEYDFR